MDTFNPEQFLIGVIPDHQWKTESYVYVIQSGEDGPVKIGLTVNPVLRLADLQSANWMTLRMVAVFGVFGSAVSLEQRAHQVAADYRIRGEWFDLHPMEAIEVVLAAAKLIDADILPLAEANARTTREMGQRLHAEFEQAEVERRRKLRRALGCD